MLKHLVDVLYNLSFWLVIVKNTKVTVLSFNVLLFYTWFIMQYKTEIPLIQLRNDRLISKLISTLTQIIEQEFYFQINFVWSVNEKRYRISTNWNWNWICEKNDFWIACICEDDNIWLFAKLQNTWPNKTSTWSKIISCHLVCMVLISGYGKIIWHLILYKLLHWKFKIMVTSRS